MKDFWKYVLCDGVDTFLTAIKLINWLHGAHMRQTFNDSVAYECC